MLKNKLKIYQNQLRDFLVNFIEKEEKNYCDQKWSKDVFKRLKLFAVNGKLFRGSLCLTTADTLKKQEKIPLAYLKTAAALELIHSALLIQDDIMDQDQLRRGQSTIHQQYQNLAQTKDFKNPELFGISTAVCVSDLCHFLAFDLINQAKLKPNLKNKLISSISQDINKTALAQISDCEFANSPKNPSQNEILNMYLYKTGRYTFSLPMLCGAYLAEQDKNAELLAKIGEKLGIIFQIKDDELGIFGESKNTGKPVGNDIKENKKTVWRYWLLNSIQKKQNSELKQIKKLFGRKNLNQNEVESVKQAIIKFKVNEKIDETINQKIEEIDHLKQKTKPQTQLIQFIDELLQFNLKREK